MNLVLRARQVNHKASHPDPGCLGFKLTLKNLKDLGLGFRV